MKYRLLFIILALILWVGCYDEAGIIPTEKPEMKLQLPQGNHDFDLQIVDWNQRCGFYILYKFEPKDVYWNLTNWDQGIWDTVKNKYVNIGGSMNIYKIEPAEEEYVGELVQFLEDQFLTFYSDSVLARWMPMKLLLCSELQNVSWGSSEKNIYSGFDLIAVNHCNETWEELSSDEKITLQDELNLTFLKRSTDNNKIEISEKFGRVSAYKNEYLGRPADAYAAGYLVTGTPNLKADWDVYIKAAITVSYDVLIAESDATDRTFCGILHPNKDTQGLIREKYDILVRYFLDRYGVDLRKIGDTHGEELNQN